MMDSPQNQPVFVYAAAIKNEGAINMAVRSNNETDAHPYIVVSNRQ
jgi:hypothetical protein